MVNIFLTAYVDLGSSCTIIRLSDVQRLRLLFDKEDTCIWKGYGHSCTTTLK